MPDIASLEVTEAGAAQGVTASLPVSAVNSSNNQVKVEAYRRYFYRISHGSNAGSIERVGPVWHVTFTVLPSGAVYEADADVASETGENIVEDFRSWLWEGILDGNLSVATCQQYVDLYAWSDPSLNLSFKHQVQTMLDACPAIESSAEVDKLVASVAAALNFSAE